MTGDRLDGIRDRYVQVRNRLDPARSAARGILGGNDFLLFVFLMLAVYGFFVGLGTMLGYGLNAQFNALRRVTFLTAVYALVVLALNLHWGYTGLFNIGVAGFMASGVYAYAILTAPVTASPPGLGLPWIVGLAGGVLVAALVGFVAALPALRLRADYLAIVTIAFAEIIRLSLQSTAFQKFSFLGVTAGTGGSAGISITKNPRAIVLDLLLENPLVQPIYRPFEAALQNMGVVPNVTRGWIYALFLLAIVGAFYWVLARTGNSPFGRVLKAIREDEDVAQALGKNTRRFKIKSFMVGCGLMGLAAILWQGQVGFVQPANFMPKLTFFVWIALIIGGAGSNTGSVFGSALFIAALFEGPRYVSNVISRAFELGSAPSSLAGAVPALLSGDVTPLLAYLLGHISSLRLVGIGVVLIILMQRRPDGLFGHRKETAASIDLSRPENSKRYEAATTDGGTDHGGTTRRGGGDTAHGGTARRGGGDSQ